MDGRHLAVRGCSRVSEGCRHCYAERLYARNLPELRSPTTGKAFAQQTPHGPRWTGKVELIPSKLDEPLRWRKPRRVFVNSMSDLFHEALPNEDIDQVFGVMAIARDQTFQVLTKRPGRMLDHLRSARERVIEAGHEKAEQQRATHRDWRRRWPCNDPNGVWPLPNVWLGVSVEDQATADERIPLLLQTRAAVRFVSYEPALAAVDFRPWLPARGQFMAFDQQTADSYQVPRGEMVPARISDGPKLDWIICGAESGPGARAFQEGWARSTRDQCQAAGCAFFYKQDARRGRKIPTPELDGRRWVEFPA